MFATIAPPPLRLLVFARLPELGRVKTRLAAAVGEQRALAAYERMVRDLLRSIGEPTPEMEIEIMWAPSASADGERLRRAFGDRPLAMQSGATLGDRLAMAFAERFFFHRTQKIIAIGVDDPLLPRRLVDHAFELLESCDWVVGPATDGGYYLIGSRAAAYDASVFLDIEWGTPTVLETTLRKIRAMNATVALLPPRSDIDTAEDLQRYEATAS